VPPRVGLRHRDPGAISINFFRSPKRGIAGDAGRVAVDYSLSRGLPSLQQRLVRLDSGGKPAFPTASRLMIVSGPGRDAQTEAAAEERVRGEFDRRVFARPSSGDFVATVRSRRFRISSGPATERVPQFVSSPVLGQRTATIQGGKTTSSTETMAR